MRIITKNWRASFALCLAVAILCGLGTWQLYRLDWKNSLINQLELEYTKNPKDHRLSVQDLTSITSNSPRIGTIKFQGTDGAYWVGPKSYTGGVGYRPFWIVDQGDTSFLIAGEVSPFIEHVVMESPLTVSGLALYNERQVREIIKLSGTDKNGSILPIIIYPENADMIGHYPNNNHLQYAIFWFFMAFLAILIFYIRFKEI